MLAHLRKEVVISPKNHLHEKENSYLIQRRKEIGRLLYIIGNHAAGTKIAADVIA